MAMSSHTDPAVALAELRERQIALHGECDDARNAKDETAPRRLAREQDRIVAALFALAARLVEERECDDGGAVCCDHCDRTHHRVCPKIGDARLAALEAERDEAQEALLHGHFGEAMTRLEAENKALREQLAAMGRVVEAMVEDHCGLQKDAPNPLHCNLCKDALAAAIAALQAVEQRASPSWLECEHCGCKGASHKKVCLVGKALALLVPPQEEK